jgi:peptidoglycan/xylan/chitin deacetylase (PgdA/CDA1 family)
MTALQQDVRALRSIALPPDVDVLDIEFRAGDRVLAHVEAAVAGSLAPREIAQMALEAMGLRRFLRESRLMLHWQWWLLFVGHVGRVGIRVLLARLRRTPRPARGLRDFVELVLRRSVLSAVGPPLAEGATERAAVRLMNRIRSAATVPSSVTPAAEPRTAPQASGQTDRIPILMYHRIAETGPQALASRRVSPADFAAQMRWLHLHGYHAVTSAEIVRHLVEGRPFEGQPVVLTFDDAYRDFHDVAWPILRDNGHRAEVFVVVGLIGKAAMRDGEHGPAPLMDWRAIRALAAEGVRFGGHMTSLRCNAGLSLRQITEEAAISRAVLEQALGGECRSISAPFGEDDARFLRIARACGYSAGFTVRPGVARLGDDPLRLPRVEVRSGMALSAFERAIAEA